MRDSRVPSRQNEPDSVDYARFIARAVGLSASDAAQVAEETEVVTMDRALSSGAVIIRRLPEGRAWVLREGVVAELVRALCPV